MAPTQHKSISAEDDWTFNSDAAIDFLAAYYWKPCKREGLLKMAARYMSPRELQRLERLHDENKGERTNDMQEENMRLEKFKTEQIGGMSQAERKRCNRLPVDMLQRIRGELTIKEKCEAYTSGRQLLHEWQYAAFEAQFWRHLIEWRSSKERVRAMWVAQNDLEEFEQQPEVEGIEQQPENNQKRQRVEEEEPRLNDAKRPRKEKKRMRKQFSLEAEGPGAYQTIIRGSPVSFKEESATPRVKSEAVGSPQVKLEYIRPLCMKMEDVKLPKIEPEGTTPSRIKIENTTPSPITMLDALPFRVKMDQEEL